MNDFRDYNDYLMHYGVKGMHWGIRRYQPYPSGKSGKFIGSVKNKIKDLLDPEKREERKKAYVQKHKRKIISSPQLTSKYYHYLTDAEIEAAKKEARTKGELYKQSMNIYARPKEIAGLITATAAAAVALATLNKSPFGVYVRKTLAPELRKISYKAIRNARNSQTPSVKRTLDHINKRSLQEILASKNYSKVIDLSSNKNRSFSELARRNNAERMALLSQQIRKNRR